MYKFCKANGGWWYVCDTLTGLLEYYEKTQHHIGEMCLRDVLGMPAENGEEGMRVLVDVLARKGNMSKASAYSFIKSSIFSSQFVAVNDGKTVFINKKGGYNFGFPECAIESVVYMPKLLFPQYSSNDIRVSKFSDAGTHYYARVGEIEVSSGAGMEKVIKWDSYEEAYRNALRYCCDA